MFQRHSLSLRANLRNVLLTNDCGAVKHLFQQSAPFAIDGVRSAQGPFHCKRATGNHITPSGGRYCLRSRFHVAQLANVLLPRVVICQGCKLRNCAPVQHHHAHCGPHPGAGDARTRTKRVHTACFQRQRWLPCIEWLHRYRLAEGPLRYAINRLKAFNNRTGCFGHGAGYSPQRR